MTADEAKQALNEGKKVRCVKWIVHEYISKGFNEDFTDSIFEANKDDDWEIVE